MVDRIKGVRVGIYTENFDDLLRQYQDPEGWAITDAGVNEDEKGYYLGLEARGVGGAIRQISIILSQDALTAMLDAIEDRFSVADTFTRATTSSSWGTFSLEDLAWNSVNECCTDGCSCRSESLS